MRLSGAAFALAIVLAACPAPADGDSPSKEHFAAEEATQPDSPAPSLSLSLLLQKQISLSLPQEALPVAREELVPPPKKFLPAFLEVTAYNVIPNRWNCWVRGKECVTLDSWRQNLRRGFAYDPDKFATNNLSHPQQGGLYYAAARSNGFSLYESALFTFYGSLTWEYFGETSRPSTNDLIVTTLSGVSSGETSYRLSELVFDDTETGFRRFLREVAGLAASPGRALHRLTTGEAWRVAPNTAEKPGWLDFELAGGWLRVESTRPSAETLVRDLVTLPMNLDYGNPFERDLGKPFSSFHLEAEFTNGKNVISRVQTEGILSARGLDGAGPDRTLVGLSFVFDYLNLDLSFGQQALGFGVWSRFFLGRGWDLLTRTAIIGSFAAVQTSEDPSPTTSRNYDYAVGGGLRAGARLRRKARDVVRLSVDELFLATANGPTRWNEVTIAKGSAWLPLSHALSLGAEYTWQRHRNVFPEDTQLRTSGQARVMVGWAVWSGAP